MVEVPGAPQNQKIVRLSVTGMVVGETLAKTLMGLVTRIKDLRLLLCGPDQRGLGRPQGWIKDLWV